MKRQFWGLVVTLIGVMALLQMMNVFNFGLAFWPVILTLVGIGILGSSFRKFNVFGLALGLWVGGIGLADILVNAGVDTAGVTGGTIAANGWPLLLVAIGVSLLFGRKAFRVTFSTDWEKGKRSGSNRTGSVGDLRIGNQEWTLDGDLTVEHGIGDVKVDLTTARMTPGVHNVQVRLGLGDLVIRVPDDVNVEALGQVGIGDCDVLGVRRSGVAANCSQNLVAAGESDVTLKVTAQCGLGDLDVVQRPATIVRVITE